MTTTENNDDTTNTQHQRLLDSYNSDVRQLPGFDDLSSRLKFSPKDGRIWLDNRRMVLLHTGSLGALRTELIETLGMRRARALLTRMGYSSGAQDAELAAKLRPASNFFDVFSVGPQLHALEGVVLVEPVRLEADVTKGQYYGEFLWKDSSEDEIHIETYGIGADPVCWMQIGYACGYTSVFMGRPIFYREVECRAMGHQHCRIVGKPLDEWDDIEEDLEYLQPQAFANRPAIKVSNKTAAVMSDQDTDGNNAQVKTTNYDEMVGASAAFNVTCHMLERVGRTAATVLFTGESGVGKEMFARTLHKIGPRKEKPFVAINCAAIPEHLIEAELFGVEKGAFTGAIEARAGRFERADTGALFLDEIGTLTLSAQGKLLRALQEGEIERVGGKRVRQVDVRVIAATNEDLRQAIKEGRFREDLFFRLNVFPINIPPLRERKADIPLLMNHFLKKFSQRYEKPVLGFTERAIDGFLNYDWPGNIRELENLVERGVILAPDGETIDLCHLFTFGEKVTTDILALGKEGKLNRATDKDVADQPAASGKSFVDSILDDETPLEDIEQALLEATVDRAQGNLSAAARMLGISRPQLAYRLKKLETKAHR